jgi:hypothetical protein
METSVFPKTVKSAEGFTVLETMLAVVILSVGLLALTALMSSAVFTTERSRYMSTAALLASEKLEELSRYPVNDAAIAVTSGSTAGSLSSDVGPATVIVGGASESVSYFDEVRLATGDGTISETKTETGSGGSIQYTTVIQTPDGQNNAPAVSSTPPSPTGGTLIYKRRWVIERDNPVADVRRITVRVALQNAPGGKPVSFQTSMVRP